MKKTATIKDVAQSAGVSISTASRVLNGNARVNGEMREKVLKAAELLHYSPNEIARSLKSSTTKEIGFIVSNMDDQYFTAISRGIENEISPLGYSLIVCNTHFSLEKERAFLRLFQKRRVSGLIINTVGGNEEEIAELSHTIPTALCGRRVNLPSFHGDFVDFDNYTGMYQLTEHLLRAGHRNIGIINGPRNISTASERFSGFRDAMLTSGIDVDHNYPYIPQDCREFSQEFGYKRTEELLTASAIPSAIIATNGATAVGAITYFKENNISIPDDLSFCYFDSITHSDLFYIHPTYICTNRQALGHQLASLLLSRIDNPVDAVNREIRLPTNMVKGTSVKNI